MWYTEKNQIINPLVSDVIQHEMPEVVKISLISTFFWWEAERMRAEKTEIKEEKSSR